MRGAVRRDIWELVEDVVVFGKAGKTEWWKAVALSALLCPVDDTLGDAPPKNTGAERTEMLSELPATLHRLLRLPVAVPQPPPPGDLRIWDHSEPDPP